MRPRKKDRHLPACMYFKHGCYYYVKKNKWHRLDTDYQVALMEYARMTVAQGEKGMAALIERVMKELRKTLKPNTIQQYEQAAGRCKEIFAEFEPRQVLPKHIAALKLSMSETPSMANRMLAFLSTVFKYALEWQEIDSNPCTGIMRYTEKGRDRYITDNEFASILKHSLPYMRHVFLMCYLTGQRINDVLSIKLDDITEEGIFFVQQKTGARLIVAMSDDLAELVEEIIRTRKPRHCGSLFTFSREGKPVSYGAAKRYFAIAREKAGVENVKIHDIRAKSLTDAKRQGLDAQKLSGHTDARMTARYIRAREIDVATPPSASKVLDR